MDLTNKVAVVTGGGRGIGRAIALALAERGAAVTVCARTRSEIDAVADEIRRGGGKALAVACDISKPEQVERLVAAALAEFGTLDVLVNNAGVYQPLHPVGEITLDEWDAVMAVNARGTFIVTHAVLPTLLEKKSGAIILISSAVARHGAPTAAAYCASKAAALLFSEALAAEVNPLGIKVSTIVATPVNTRMRWEATPDHPRARVIQPGDIARAVTHLLEQDDRVNTPELVVSLLE